MRVTNADFDIHLNVARDPHDDEEVRAKCKTKGEAMLAELNATNRAMEIRRIKVVHLLLSAGEPIPPGLLFPFYFRDGLNDPRTAVNELTRCEGMIVADEDIFQEANYEVDAWLEAEERIFRDNKRRRSMTSLDEAGFSDNEEALAEGEVGEAVTTTRRLVRRLIGGNGMTYQELLLPAVTSQDVPPVDHDL